MPAGAPFGNKNAANAARNSVSRPRIWSAALRSAMLERSEKGGKRIRKLARALLDKAESGDVAALKEFGDRIEGKVPQSVTGPEGGAIIHTIERVIVEKA